MPLFEYKCDDCDRQFEELTSGDSAGVPCPDCGSANTHKLLSVFAAGVSAGSGAPSCGSPGCGSGFS